jgi:predicted unusual protein kinase regulating ubiquinone biosynthesis (AarF/ABC1/UbiB family)
VPAAPNVPPALRALLEAGGAVVRQSSSGRVALGRAAESVPADVLPAALHGVHRALVKAHEQSTRPLAFKDVERVLKGAWRRPPGKVLADLEREPVAVTPAAQVHRGESDDGPVAIKVRRPGLTASMRNDLALLDTLSAPLRQVFGRLDAGATLRAVREMVLDELDGEHEGSTQRHARRLLRGVEGLVVPAPVLDLCHEDVLVSAWLEGPTLRDAAPDDPAAVARTLVAAHLTAARAGLLLTDARPGHVVLLDGGGVGLLGVGRARPLDRTRVDHAMACIVALRGEDEGAFSARVTGDLGVLASDSAGKAYALMDELLGDLLRGPATLDGPALATAGDGALRRLGALLELAAEVTPQPDDVAAVRALGQLASLLSRLGAQEDWGALATHGV